MAEKVKKKKQPHPERVTYLVKVDQGTKPDLVIPFGRWEDALRVWEAFYKVAASAVYRVTGKSTQQVKP